MTFAKERVKEAYDKAGIQPMRGGFVSTKWIDGKLMQCGCAVTAMLIAEKGYTWEEVKKLDENDEMTYVNIGEWFDVKTLDVQHFLMGFDCQLPEKLNDDDKAGNEAALFVGLEMI